MIHRFLTLRNIHSIALLAGLLTLPMLFQFTPEDDCADRYARMAEAFAAGNFDLAFHSRFMPLFPVLTGSIVMLLNCSGYFACKLVCWLFFVLSVYPLYRIALLTVGNKGQALIAAAMLPFCYPLVAFIGDGNRENVKAFLLLCAAWSLILFWKDPRWRNAVMLAVSAAGLSLIRGDGAMLALGMLIVPFIRGRTLNPRLGLLAAAMYLLILSPWLYFQYHNIGYPVPETRHAMLLARLESHIPALESLRNPAARHSLVQRTPVADAMTSENSSIVISAKSKPQPRFLPGLIKGLYPLFFIVALCGGVMRVRNKKWEAADSILLALFAGHGILMILQILIADNKLYVSSRYIQSSLPLYLPWCAVAIDMFYGFGKQHLQSRWHFILPLIAIGIMIPSYQQGVKQVLRERLFNSKAIAEKQAIITIINNAEAPRMPAAHSPYDCHFVASPVILTDLKSIGYYTGSTVLTLDTVSFDQVGVAKLVDGGRLKFLIVRDGDSNISGCLKACARLEMLYSGKMTLYRVNPLKSL